MKTTKKKSYKELRCIFMGKSLLITNRIQPRNSICVLLSIHSERVLRKKYFNMIEDMKGKIRVYCRSRPLSKTELGRGNFSIINSPDEFTIHVKTNRGVKEFAFDRLVVLFLLTLVR